MYRSEPHHLLHAAPDRHTVLDVAYVECIVKETHYSHVIFSKYIYKVIDVMTTGALALSLTSPTINSIYRTLHDTARTSATGACHPVSLRGPGSGGETSARRASRRGRGRAHWLSLFPELRDFLCEISSRSYPERYLLHLYLYYCTVYAGTGYGYAAKTRTSTRYFTRSLCTHRVSLHRLATTCADGADPLGSRRGSRTQPGPRGRARPYWPARRAALSCSPSPSGAPT